MAKPKVCYFRGSYLNPFETQYLEPLMDEYEMVVAHTKSHRYDVSGIKIPQKSVACLDYINGLIPRRVSGRLIPNPLKYFGYDEIVFGLDDLLSDVNIVHMPEQSFYSSYQIAQRKEKHRFKLISVQDEVNPFWYVRRSTITKRTKVVQSATDLFIARTERAKAALLCEGVPEEKISIVGHGVDTRKFIPGERNLDICKKLNIDKDRFIILFVGNLFWTKGVLAIANAAKLLLMNPLMKKKNPLFLMVGQGDERAELEQRIKLLGIEKNFLLTGNLPYDLLPDIHRLADIFILPSISTRYILEQFGIAIIESMSSGKPVISTHCGAIDEVVGDAGVLVQPNDYYRLHESLLRLIENEELRIELGRKARRRVEDNFSHAVISGKITRLYERVLTA